MIDLLATLIDLTRLGAAERAAHEDGRDAAPIVLEVELAFTRARLAGVPDEEADAAYRVGVDRGCVIDCA